MRTCPDCQLKYADEMDFCPRDATPLSPANKAETQFDLSAALSSRYRIIRRIGEGGMGEVFLAEQLSVGNRPVALKVLRRKLLDDPSFLQRFEDEASSTGRIHHPNVVTVYEYGQTEDGDPYIAMEYLEGESLRQSLKRRGSLPLDFVSEILQQAARGLNAAHRLGIIHRDLKPDNILLTHHHDDVSRPVVKIVDFGIAKMLESSTRTQTGLAIGTPCYMSVEQAAGMRSNEMDGRSDVYSLGIVVYELIAGQLPFQADTPVGYLGKHLTEPPKPLRSARPDLLIAVQIEQAVMKALSKKREERHATVLDFAQEFATAVAGSGVPAEQVGAKEQNRQTATEPQNGPSASPPARAPEQKKPVYVLPRRNAFISGEPIASVAVLLPLALAGAWYALRSNSPAEQAAPATVAHQVPFSREGAERLSLSVGQQSYPAAAPDRKRQVNAALAPGNLNNRALSAKIPRAETAQAQGQHLNQRHNQPTDDGASHDGGSGAADLEVYRAGGDISSPLLIYSVEPVYSEEAIKARYSGVVKLSATIDEHGIPANIAVTTPLGLGLDEKAVEAVQHWRYLPGVRHGKPVKVRVSLTITFKQL